MSASILYISTASVEMCDDCNREATVFNEEGSYCELHSGCWECGHPAEIKRHCFDCWGSMICEEMGLPERLAA
jgi:hypothetical protein